MGAIRKSAELLIAVVSFSLILSVCSVSASSNATVRIVGGSATTIKRVPYLVNIRANGAFICGGTLVSRIHVVTAAHCVHGTRAKSLLVTGGATRLTRRGKRVGVAKIILPSRFRMSTLNKDVAVLKLKKPLRGRNIRPIRLCNRSWRAGMTVKVSGWGLTKETNTNVPDRVQTVNVPLITKNSCKDRYRGRAKITASMFCAGTAGRDSCSGDSGGPLIYKRRLCGVVSWGIGCAQKKFPGVYTNIRRVRGFLRIAMRL